VLKSSSLSLAVIASLAASVNANAKPSARLSIATARRAIIYYERQYWTGEGATLKVDRCRRADSHRVSCLAEAVKPGQTVLVRDWVTRVSRGIIRIHPGSFATVTALESEAPAGEG